MIELLKQEKTVTFIIKTQRDVDSFMDILGRIYGGFHGSIERELSGDVEEGKTAYVKFSKDVDYVGEIRETKPYNMGVVVNFTERTKGI